MAGAVQRPKIFQLSEANATLPHLTELLAKLRVAMEEARELKRKLRVIKAVGHDKFGVLIMAKDYRLCRERFDAAAKRANEAIEAIHRLGCVLKSAELGIVDFPGVLNGQPVLFCWRVGEPRVSHYHLWSENFSARRPFTEKGARSEDVHPVDGD